MQIIGIRQYYLTYEIRSLRETMKKKCSIIVLSTFSDELAALSLQAILNPLLPCHIQTAPYNQIFQELLNPSSITLTNHKGYANAILFRLTDLSKKKSNDVTEHSLLHDPDNLKENLNELIQLIQTGTQSCKIPWVVCVCPENPYYIADSTQINYLRQLEEHIQTRLNNIPNVYFINPGSVSHLYPSQDFSDHTSDQLGNIPYKFEYFCLLGVKIARTIYSIFMKPYKVIVLDCDETLWTGLCGEDGWQGISLNEYQKKLQEFMLEQMNAGMLLCICSKNNEEDVKKVFDFHPKMILQLENFVGFKVNWKTKSENILELSRQLNLNLDSFIFIDDNPMECAEVSSRFPQIFTIQVPKDSQEMLSLIQHLWIFDHTNITNEDHQRTTFYRQEMDRSILKENTKSLIDFIRKLELNVQIQLAKEQNFPRILQLIKRCNQFNFTGKSYSIDSVEKLSQQLKNDHSYCYVISVTDRIGDYGETGVVIAQVMEKELSIQSFLLSCRILGKSVEHRVVVKLAEIAHSLNLSTIKFHFFKSSKNEPAHQFFFILSQLPHSSIHEIDKKNKCCLVTVQDALALSYQPPHLFSQSNPEDAPKEKNQNKQKKSAQEFNSRKMLIDMAHQSSSLQSLVNLIKQYQKNLKKNSHKNVAYIPPINAHEKYLQKIFEKILNISPVSTESDFFDLGSSSLMGTLLLSEISQFYSIRLTIDWLFQAPTIKKLARLIDDAVKNKTFDLSCIPMVHREDKLIPLSFAQQRIWFLYQLHPDSALYNTFIALQLHGKVKENAVIKSFNTLVDRHESLRTTFLIKEGTAYQIIHSPKKLSACIEVLSAEDLSIDEIRNKAYLIAQRPFDLQSESLLRITLLKQAEDNYYLFFCSHHIIIDGHSFNILMREFSQLYTAYSQDRIPLLNPVKIQYADFSVWQRQWLQGDIWRQQQDYWLKKLTDLPSLNFPTDFPRTEEMSTQGKRISFHLDQSFLNRLRDISRKMNVTLFTTIISCYAILLSKYTEKKDIVIGTGISGRQYPGIENIIGHFVNILLLRFDLTENPSFLNLISRNHQIILEAYAHQDVPFEELVKALSPHRNITEHPLAQMMLVFQEGNAESMKLPEVRVNRVFSDNNNLLLLADYDNAKLDITLDLQVTEKGLEGLIEYNCHLFETKTIERFIEHFSNILISVCNNPEQCCVDISIFSAMEYQKILFDWNKTTIAYPKKMTVVQMFEQRAQEQPDHIAVSFYDQQYTYRWLNEKANQIAYYLQTKNLRAQMLVGLFFDRGIDLIVSLLAVFKIGAVYLPISSNLPDEQIKYLLDDSGTHYIITTPTLHQRITELSNHQKNLTLLPINCLTCGESTFQVNKNLILPIMPDHTACLIYTSGSTGKSKGVLIKHQGLLNTTCAQIEYLKINEHTHVLQWASMNFDASLWEILGALAAGAKLCLIREDDILNSQRFIQILQEQAISLLTVTPSYLNALPNADLPKLHTLVVAGEPCPLTLLKRWATGRRFVNAYGLTEVSICTTLETLTPDAERVTLGKPIANTQVYILSQERQPMPIGVAGELYIAGDGVANGYHQRSDLNKERFLFNPFNPLTPEAKMYRTGDWVRWLPDGSLQYVGRQDDLIKIRGIRTNLNAIANVIQEHPLVAHAEVILKTYSLSDQRLIAYLVLRGESNHSSSCILNNQHLKYWQTLYENLYKENSQLTTEGWESSYTHHPIPKEEMQEWINNTVDRILALSPLKVLEIGCGNGLLVHKIAPSCQQYLATDFSQHALDALNAYLSTEATLPQVTTQQRLAHEFSNEESNRYDTIILNSVVQYFPHIDYLVTVLDQCMNAVKSGGQIYIGDVRNLDYQEAFHSDVEYYKLGQNSHATQITFDHWHHQINNRVSQDPELVISPRFFYWYAQRHPDIEGVTIELRKGIHDNEMNCFRYDVILHLNKEKPTSRPKYLLPECDWRQENINLKKLEDTFKNQNLDGLKIKNIPNLRVQQASLLKECRNAYQETTNPIVLTWIENYLKTHSTKAFDPEIFWQLGDRTHYQVYVTFSQENPETDMDVIFVNKNKIKDQNDWLNWITSTMPYFTVHLTDDLSRYANTPLQVTLVKYISKQMQLFLRQQLPGHLIPAAFVLLNKMPLTRNGKIDKTALPEPHIFTTYLHHPHQKKALDNISISLRKIFAKILNLAEEQVNDQDNFFYIGGHSLLAMQLINEIQKCFHIEFNIRDLFKFSSVSEIVPVIKKIKIQVSLPATEKIS